MTDWTTARVTPEMQAELRRLLDAATPGPWRDEMMQGKGVTLTAIIAGRPNPDDLRVIGSTLAHNDACVLIAAVNALPALLDAAAERDEIAGRLAHLLYDLTGGRMSKTSYPVFVMAQEIEQYLSECHESDLKDERDALAAAVERVRALHIAHDCTSHAGIATICAHRPGICLACLKPLPCPTIRALDTTPETGGES